MIPDWLPRPGTPDLVAAVDVPSLDDALRLRDQLAGVVPCFKIGKELFTAAGPRAVAEFADAGRVFLDLKFHDIPATVAGAVRAAARTGAGIVDVHASGGRAMMEAAAEAARDAPVLLLAVTVLTHLDPAGAAEVFGGKGSIRERVLRLARLASASGADGVVASAHELEALREDLGESLVALVPGVRPDWAAATHDQRRVATPREAAERGAHFVVLGRALTLAPDPRAAALRVRDEIG